MEQTEKCKCSESPPYGSYSNDLEEIDYGRAKFPNSYLMNLKTAALLEFRGPFILPFSLFQWKTRDLKIQSHRDNLSLKKVIESLIKHKIL